jgi:hypothetical protein
MIQGGINGSNMTAVVMIIGMAYARTRPAFMITTARISGAVSTSSDAVDDLVKLITHIIGPRRRRRIYTSGRISTIISTIQKLLLMIMMMMMMMVLITGI